MNYRNFTSSAAWPLTMLDHDQWMTLGEHSDWNLVEGFRLESVGFDLMHNVFLGVGKDLVGSGLKLLIQQGAFDHVEGVHDDLDKALGVIHQEMVQDCKNHGLSSCMIKSFYFSKMIVGYSAQNLLVKSRVINFFSKKQKLVWASHPHVFILHREVIPSL